SQRLVVSGSRAAADGPPVPLRPELAARLSDTANDSQRVLDTLQMLSADRERILIRLASVERSLDEMTSSAKRSDDITSATRRNASTPAPKPASLPAQPEQQSPVPEQDTSLPAAAPIPQAKAEPAMPAAGNGPAAGSVAELEALKFGPDIGIELG